ncbi:MAG: hypothetical protein AAFP04_12350 [Myxococcota bacterium]
MTQISSTPTSIAAASNPQSAVAQAQANIARIEATLASLERELAALRPPKRDDFERPGDYKRALLSHQQKVNELQRSIADAKTELQNANAQLEEARATERSEKPPVERAAGSSPEPTVDVLFPTPEALHKGLEPAERGLAFDGEGAQPRVETPDEIAARWDDVEP